MVKRVRGGSGGIGEGSGSGGSNSSGCVSGSSCISGSVDTSGSDGGCGESSNVKGTMRVRQSQPSIDGKQEPGIKESITTLKHHHMGNYDNSLHVVSYHECIFAMHASMGLRERESQLLRATWGGGRPEAVGDENVV